MSQGYSNIPAATPYYQRVKLTYLHRFCASFFLLTNQAANISDS